MNNAMYILYRVLSFPVLIIVSVLAVIQWFVLQATEEHGYDYPLSMYVYSFVISVDTTLTPLQGIVFGISLYFITTALILAIGA